jgi:hypothetical protein
MRRSFLPSLVLIASMTTAAWRSAAAQPAEADTLDARALQPQSHWYGIYSQDKKMGYGHTKRTIEKDAVRETFTMVLKLVSNDQKSEVSVVESLVFEAKPPHRLQSGESELFDGKNRVRRRLQRQGERFEVVQEAGGEVTKRDHGPIDYTLLDATSTERWIRRAPKAGASIPLKEFSLQELKLDTGTNKVLAVKKAVVGGVPVTHYEIESETKLITLRSHYDDKGRMLAGKFSVFDLRLETEAQAKKTEYSDLFETAKVKIDRSLGSTRRVRELVVEVTGLDGVVIEDGPRQRFTTGQEKGTGLLKLGKKYGKEMKASAKDIAEALEETLTYPITHPKIKALAATAVGDATTAEDKVKRLVEFVHQHIEGDRAPGLPNIHDLLQQRKGDCKSYALLFATLARAAGVPAREISGLIHIGDDYKAFGGHAWNEVVLNGSWVPVDASWKETEVNATHISFGTQDQATKSLLDAIGKLSFKLVEVKTGE